jgi:hypothetical protein
LVATDSTVDAGIKGPIYFYQLSAVVDAASEYFVRVFGTASDNSDYLLQVDAVESFNPPSSVIPLPAAAWLFGSALMGFGWLGRKSKTQLS